MLPFVIFPPGKLSTAIAKPFNVIATGPSRGGTSLFGSLLHELGFYLGQRVHPVTFENLDFADIAHDERIWDVRWQELIVELNQRTPGWALKLPHAMRRPDIFDRHALNPIFFVMVRNFLPTIASLMKFDETYKETLFDFRRGYEHFKFFFEPLFSNLQALTAPVVFCNYELAMADLQKFVKIFCQLVAIPKTPEEINAIILGMRRHREQYANSERHQ